MRQFKKGSAGISTERKLSRAGPCQAGPGWAGLGWVVPGLAGLGCVVGKIELVGTRETMEGRPGSHLAVRPHAAA